MPLQAAPAAKRYWNRRVRSGSSVERAAKQFLDVTWRQHPQFTPENPVAAAVISDGDDRGDAVL